MSQFSPPSKLNSQPIGKANSNVANVPTTTVQLEKSLPGIHGLRGIAALAIVLDHIVHIAKTSVPEFFSFVSSTFSMGMHLFFVVSAFSLMHSIEHTIHRATWAAEYFVKLFFRIAPLSAVVKVVVPCRHVGCAVSRDFLAYGSDILIGTISDAYTAFGSFKRFSRQSQ